MGSVVLRRIRRICLGFPGAFEVLEEAHKFSVAGRGFAAFWAGPVPSVWCKGPPGALEEMIAADPERFFRPAWKSRRAGSACGWSRRRTTGTSSPPCSRSRTGWSRRSGSHAR